MGLSPMASVRPTIIIPPLPFFLFHLLIPPHLPLFHLSPAHLFSKPQYLWLPLCFPLSSHSVILSLLPIQKEAQSLHGSVGEGVLTHQQTKKEKIWALCFSFSVWESGILQNWMTLVNRFKSYWRGTNRQTDNIKLISFWITNKIIILK